MSERAWAAGFFDGEGTIRVNRNGSLRLSVPQTERSTLDRLQVAIGGTVYGTYRPRSHKAHWKSQYHLVASGANAIEAIDRMWKWLSMPKRAQAANALALYKGGQHARSCNPE